MKKIFMLSIMVMLLAVMTVPVMADTLITPVNGATYTNPEMALPNSEPTTEEMFLENILGLTYNDPSVFYIDKNEDYFSNDDLSSLNNWDPSLNVSWTYAIVKVDGQNDGWYAYVRDDADGLGLTVGPFRHAISHVTFFGTTAVPEPATLILLGLGLLGIAGIRRRK